MANRRFTRTIVAGAIGAGGLIAAAPTTLAGAATPAAVVVNAKCSGSSMSNLQLQREDTGRLSVDFGVDMARHKAGIQWRISGTDNGTPFVNATVKTIRDGSFSVTRLLTPATGINAVVATASNAATGETCSISGSI